MYYVYKIEWSQTDSEYVIFYCKDNKPDAYLKQRYVGVRYFQFICKSDKILNT